MSQPFGTIPTTELMYTASELDTLINLLFSQTANGVVSGTVAETTLIGAGSGSLTIPASSLSAGDVLVVEMYGLYTDTSGTRTYRSKLAGTIQATGAINPSNGTNGSFYIRIVISIRSAGVGGTAIAQGFVEHFNSSGALAGSRNAFTPQVATFPIDTTVANTYDLTVQFSTVGSTNEAISTNFTLSKLIAP
jgi:hypothetical protein